MKKDKLVVSIIIGLISAILVFVITVQFKTINETNVTDIENMREDELRKEVISWKTKFNEVDSKLQDNYKKIEEYNSKISNNQEAYELLDSEVQQYNLLVGKTKVLGDGVIITLTDTAISAYTSNDLVFFLNELKYAGAEAVSINGKRIINMSDIVSVSRYILLNGERIASPYEVKVIGDQVQLSNVLSSDGFLLQYIEEGKQAKLESATGLVIDAYNQEIKLNYIKGE